jgi:P27 family predicted phage terminase small subunit
MAEPIGPPTPPKAPAHLKAAGRRFYNEIAAEWEQGSHERLLLIAACEQIDVAESCRKTIAQEGLEITTVKGARKENPAVCTMRQATRLIQSLVRQMDLTESPDTYKGRVRQHRHR